jgi:hypothetical protein
MIAALLVSAVPARAELTVFQTFTGNVAVSTDGWGGLSTGGTISASVPAGATVLAAYLYTAITPFGTSGIGGTLEGTPVAYGALVNNPSNSLKMARADVTSIVKPIIDGGAGGTYDFDVTETNTGLQDGEALVVVYSLASLPESTVGILDGFSASGGDTTSINFADPLDPSDPAFFAEMFLGIGFSAGGSQFSTVEVNDTLITNAAGGFDDGALANGALITVGGFNDAASPHLPSQAVDHERYNLVPYIDAGDTTIKVDTANPSFDDNIFLAVFHVAGIAGVNEEPPPPNEEPVPEPTSLALLGLAGAAAARRLRRQLA